MHNDPTRNHLGIFANANGLNGTFAEFGVLNGDWARFNLAGGWIGQHYLMIDTDFSPTQVAKRNNIMTLFPNRDIKHWSHQTGYRDALTRIPDLSLDVAYIDMDHDYHSQVQYLENIWPKVKRGGILAGDDYSATS